MSLKFAVLRHANEMRLPQFKNKNGERVHSEDDGSDWALSAWSNATFGEMGELVEAFGVFGRAANRIKKVERGDITLEEARKELAGEFADVVTYLDILAMRAGIDLGEAVTEKFNAVSKRVGSDVFIAAMPGGQLVAGHARPSQTEAG